MHVINPTVGSQWRRWDLHVHTPASLVNSYGGEAGWDRFLAELRGLPDGYVIGINDYLFIEGYERVLDAHRSGDLPNIASVFPVVEFRLANLVGTHGHLNRINAHVIFSNEVSPATILGQFVNGLSSSYVLDPELGLETGWTGIPTMQGLADFGAAIRASVPTDRRHEYSEADLILGFNNLVVPLEAIQQRLNDSAFRDRAILAIGKTEWESMLWNDKSIALKKSVINSGRLVFTAAADLDAYREGRKRLTEAGINDRLVDCSDAHAFGDATTKDRIGNCMTWINADPTFEGLVHAITEFDERVFVGVEPPKLAAVRLNPDHHIESVSIRAKKRGTSEADHRYFDISIPLNPGFVAIVGNKGKGKSALLDSMGLATASRNEGHYTFLHEKRFRNPQQNTARGYEVEITWVDGDTSIRGLDESFTDEEPERSTYLPQQLIDTICSADPGEVPAQRFAAELGKVLFAHVSAADRLGTTDLESLISARTKEIERRLEILRGELASINRTIAADEHRARPERRRELKGELTLAGQQLAAHDAVKPPEPQVPQAIIDDPELAALSERLDALKSQRQETELERARLQATDTDLANKADAGQQLTTALATFQNGAAAFFRLNRPRAERLGLDIDEMVTVTVNGEKLIEAIKDTKAARQKIHELLEGDGDDSIPVRVARIDLEIEQGDEKLRGPAEQFAEQVKAMGEWTRLRQRLAVGSNDAPGVEILTERLEMLDRIPKRLRRDREDRRAKVREIHAALMEIVDVYQDLYQPALTFIADHPLAAQAQLEFGAGLRERDLGALFWEIHGRNVVSSFQGMEGGNKLLDDLVSKTEFNNVDAVITFLDGLDNAIHYDVRSSPPEAVDPSRAIRTGHSLEKLYDLVFSLEYLEPVYSLEYSGVPIDRLSPGEKGTLLLMFYLLVDRSPRPLLLDQPDENLDNQTIKELLVPAIKEAKRRRQVVVITHNPNVAVVADADQILAASFDGAEFTYEGGSIESWAINKQVIDILEGTWPALTNRNAKYQPPRQT